MVDVRRCCGLKRAALTLLALMVIGRGVAVAAPAKEAAPPIVLPIEGVETPPTFRETRTQDEIRQEYPTLANALSLPGYVQLTCEVAADATVGDCGVDVERPAGIGFGAAAIHIAKGFQVNPATVDGAPVKAKLTVRIRFPMEQQQKPPTPVEAPPPPEAKLALARRVVAAANDAQAKNLLYEQSIDLHNQQARARGQTADTRAAIDAVRQGLQDAIVVYVEERAKKIASEMSEAELDATARFLESPAGRSFISLDHADGLAEAEKFQAAVASAARKRFCAKAQCEGAP